MFSLASGNSSGAGQGIAVIAVIGKPWFTEIEEAF
jgi:hypothetical protein